MFTQLLLYNFKNSIYMQKNNVKAYKFMNSKYSNVKAYKLMNKSDFKTSTLALTTMNITGNW